MWLQCYMKLSYVHQSLARISVLSVCLITSVLLAGGCDGVEDSNTALLGEPVLYEWVEKGHGVQVYEAQTRVFRDSLAWAQFWDAHVSLLDQNFQPYPPPSVDFNQEMIIGVYWGYYYTGCRIIDRIEAINGIYKRSNRIVVNIGSVPDLGPCRAMIYPTQVIRIPRSEKPVEFTGQVPEQQFEPPADSS